MTKHSTQPSTNHVPQSILERAKDATLRPEDMVEMPAGMTRQQRREWFLSQIGTTQNPK